MKTSTKEDLSLKPLVTFFDKHPIKAAAIGILTITAFFGGCWTCIQI